MTSIKNTAGLFLLLLFWGCQDLSNLDPNEAETFVRFLGDPGENRAIKILETPEGDFLALATNLDGLDGQIPDYKTLIFKTDKYGNLIWFSNSVHQIEKFRAADMALTPDGYYIIGDRINGIEGGIEQTDLMLLKTDLSGNWSGDSIVVSGLSVPSNRVKGAAVYAEGDSEVIGLGSYNNGTEIQFFLQFNIASKSINWFREEPSPSSLSPVKSLLKAGDNYVWSANSTRGEVFSARANEIIGGNNPVPVTETIDLAKTPFNSSFGGVGNEQDNVVFYKLRNNLSVERTLTIAEGSTVHSISSNSSGYVVLATNLENFQLLVTDLDGNIIVENDGDPADPMDDVDSQPGIIINWQSTEVNGDAIATSNGGYLIFGSTRVSSTPAALVLIKTDANGSL